MTCQDLEMLKTQKWVEAVLSLASLSEMQSVDIHVVWQPVAVVHRVCCSACYILEMVLAVLWMALWLVLESWVTGLPLCTNVHLALAPALASKGCYDHLWVVCAPGEGHHFSKCKAL